MDAVADPALPPPRPRLGAVVDRLTVGWRGPVLAAVLVLITSLPGLLAMPPLDRDESRFAQATAQMLETGDFVNIRYQEAARNKKLVGVHWLQALSVSLFSSAEARDIRPYRLPSLLGAMLAAAACAWGASAAFGSRTGLLAGGILGTSFLLSTEAFIGKTDALLCGAVTLSMAALARLYLRETRPETQPPGRASFERASFWVGMAAAILLKGPVGPAIAALALVSLAVADRRGVWISRLGWSWGLLLVLLLVGPWAFAITVFSDGGFWNGALGGDIAGKIAGARESHGAPPGLHLLLAPLLTFPSALVLPAAVVTGWTRRREPAVRFALAWLIPWWIVCEAMPTKLPHYPLPAYGALAWLAAAAVTGPRLGAKARIAGSALSLGAGVLLAAVGAWLAARYGDASAVPAAWLGAGLMLVAGGAGAVPLLRERPVRAVAVAAAAGVAAHVVLTGWLVPHLSTLWISRRAAALIAATELDPRTGRIVGPVATAGYAEPSLVFALGTETELDSDGAGAADALADGAPALVEQRQEAAFRARLAKRGAVAQSVGVVSGVDYSAGHPVRLTLWRPVKLAPEVEAANKEAE